MKVIRKIWNYLNGKKTTIGMTVMLIGQGIQVFFPEWMNREQIDLIQTAGALIGGFGLAHKGTKSAGKVKLKSQSK